MSLFAGQTLLVGVEPDDDDPTLTRLYLGARYKWIYVLCATEDAPTMGMGHTFINAPGPDVPVYQDPRVADVHRLPTAAPLPDDEEP